ncbi:MAG: hypothetical protein CBB87_01705 [Micavibrio sp. TMED27]|nr:hypothetical protein [Micavibrio sp.]OUT92481.1 MAG: hypothetical protein CBB87_01705 [Micavibrio sp. TMED27]|tara:strand:- start:3488 stop:4195 length:708 start_codon:yes stop_codon:yes gene_type:complete
MNQNLFNTQIKNESGNVLFIILMAVAMLGFLTAAIRSGDSSNANIDKESLAIRVSQVRSYASELERAVLFVNQNGISESDLRFAHGRAHSDYGTYSDEPERQIFHPDGGGANYTNPPRGINNGSAWEFYGTSAVPSIGTSAADLIAVLPNVSVDFCNSINERNGQSSMPRDTGTCLNAGSSGRFGDSQQFSSSPNEMDEASFAQDTTVSAVKPAPQACVICDDGARHFYYVLLAR